MARRWAPFGRLINGVSERRRAEPLSLAAAAAA